LLWFCDYFHSFPCKEIWIATVYEMCYINKRALPCLYINFLEAFSQLSVIAFYQRQLVFSFTATVGEADILSIHETLQNPLLFRCGEDL